MGMVMHRFDIWLINLNPATGKELRKTRPCMIISPDESNERLATIIAVPMTTVLRKYPTRINCNFQSKKGQLAFDQMRTFDKTRLVKHLGVMDTSTSKKACTLLKEMFEY